MDDIVKVELLGRSRSVIPPSSLIETEELWVAWRDATRAKNPGFRALRAAAALVGACTVLGREAGVTYAECRFDPLAYGGKVYDHIMAKGKPDGLVTAATTIYEVLTKRLVMFQEAQAKADFLGSGGHSTDA